VVGDGNLAPSLDPTSEWWGFSRIFKQFPRFDIFPLRRCPAVRPTTTNANRREASLKIMSKKQYAQPIIAIGICICLFIGACTSQVVAPTQTMIPTSTQFPETKTPPIPTSTSTPTLSSVQLPIIETQNSAIATRDAQVATAIAILPDCGWSSNHNYSPDGNWVAFECLEYGMGAYNLKDFSKSSYFSYYDTFGLKYENGNHFGKLKPKHWSIDGKYLYFSPFFGGDGGCVYYAEGQALLRLDLLSGKYSEVLSPTENSSYFNFSFSNDEKYLGYFEVWQEHPILNLLDFTTNKHQEIPLGEKYSGAGSIVWSPDNNQVLFSARSGDECESMVYYLVALNLKDHAQKVVFEGNQEKYFPVKWVDENLILIEAGFSEKYSYMSISTGEILPYNEPAPTSRP